MPRPIAHTLNRNGNGNGRSSSGARNFKRYACTRNRIVGHPHLNVDRLFRAKSNAWCDPYDERRWKGKFTVEGIFVEKIGTLTFVVKYLLRISTVNPMKSSLDLDWTRAVKTYSHKATQEII